MGHINFELAAATPPPVSSDTLDSRSSLVSGTGLVPSVLAVLSLELTLTVLSDGDTRTDGRAGAGGSSDLPLPSIRPPPSFRPDMAGGRYLRSKSPSELNVQREWKEVYPSTGSSCMQWWSSDPHTC